jgi:hypothetical protein
MFESHAAIVLMLVEDALQFRQHCFVPGMAGWWGVGGGKQPAL